MIDEQSLRGNRIEMWHEPCRGEGCEECSELGWIDVTEDVRALLGQRTQLQQRIVDFEAETSPGQPYTAEQKAQPRWVDTLPALPPAEPTLQQALTHLLSRGEEDGGCREREERLAGAHIRGVRKQLEAEHCITSRRKPNSGFGRNPDWHRRKVAGKVALAVKASNPSVAVDFLRSAEAHLRVLRYQRKAHLMVSEKVVDDIATELHRAHTKYAGVTIGSSRWTDAERYVILGEEVGEVGEEVSLTLGDHPARTSNLRTELVQVAAVTISWIQRIDADSSDPVNHSKGVSPSGLQALFSE